MDLTQQQINALQPGEAVPLTFAETPCVVVRKDVFDQTQKSISGKGDTGEVAVSADSSSDSKLKILQLATAVYDGLSDQDIDEIEEIALRRENFFGTRSVD